ncbi:MAG: hypothetical protein KC492_26280, partial [Myxococcales bacterium]|nr:hypothetical protein [Myxococcales bacterium]
MASAGPLDQPRLREIDELLDARELDRAAGALMQLGDMELFRHATTYLTTRLLFLRGRLDLPGVAQRLEDLLKEVADFPEAEAMLDAARSGELSEFGTVRKIREEKAARRSEGAQPHRDSDHHAVLAQATVVHQEPDAPTTDDPDIEATETDDDLDLSPSMEAEFSPSALSPDIPRAPAIPQVAVWGEVDPEPGDDSAQPSWVIPSLGPRAPRLTDSLPAPEPPSDLRTGNSTVPPFEQLGPKLTDAGLSPALHVSSIPPPPSAPPPALDIAPPADFHEAIQDTEFSAPDPASAGPGSSLSDGSVRPGPHQTAQGDAASSTVEIPRAPAIPNLAPRESDSPPAPRTGSLSPSGEYPALDFTAYDPTQRKS